MLIWDDDKNRVRYWSCKQEYEKSLQVKKQGWQENKSEQINYLTNRKM
jgi:hypothetical protein